MRFNSSNLSIKRRTAVEATDFLRRDDKMAALLPAIQRMAALQKDCATALPAMFKYCEILAFEDRVLDEDLVVLEAYADMSVTTDLKVEISTRADRLSVAYRRILADLVAHGS